MPPGDTPERATHAPSPARFEKTRNAYGTVRLML